MSQIGRYLEDIPVAWDLRSADSSTKTYLSYIRLPRSRNVFTALDTARGARLRLRALVAERGGRSFGAPYNVSVASSVAELGLK